MKGYCKLPSEPLKAKENILFRILFRLQVEPLDWKEWLACIAIGTTTCLVSWATRYFNRNVNVSLDMVWFRRSLRTMRTQSGRTGSGRAMSGRLTNWRQITGLKQKQMSGKQQNAELDQPRQSGHVMRIKVYPLSK
jgi:hypothetical protein